jgi:hypothetical protein
MAASTPTTHVTNPTYLYSFAYPSSWQAFRTYPDAPRPGIEPALDLAISMASHPREAESWSGLWLKPIPDINPWRLSLVVDARECEPIGFEDFREKFQASVETRGEQFDGARSNLALDGIEAWEIRWSVANARHSRLVVAFWDGCRFTLQLSGTQPEFDTHTPEFEAMLASFRFD